MLSRLMRVMLREPAPPDIIPARNVFLPPPSHHSSEALPEVRLQVEEASSSHHPLTPQKCMTCSPLEMCTEQPVRKTDLKNNCSICSLFLEACLKIVNLEHFDHVSAWTGRGGVFGLCLGKDGLGNNDGRDGGATRSEVNLFLASDGGAFSLVSLFATVLMGTRNNFFTTP